MIIRYIEISLIFIEELQYIFREDLYFPNDHLCIRYRSAQCIAYVKSIYKA